MRHMINFILTGAVLFFAALAFPDCVIISDTKTLLFATVFLFIAKVIVAVLLIFSLATSLLAGSIDGFFISMCSIAFADIFAIKLVDHWLPGFAVRGGFWPILMLAFALTLVQIPNENHA